MTKAIRISACMIGLLTLIGVADCARDPVRQSPCEGTLLPIHTPIYTPIHTPIQTPISDPDAKAGTPP